MWLCETPFFFFFFQRSYFFLAGVKKYLKMWFPKVSKIESHIKRVLSLPVILLFFYWSLVVWASDSFLKAEGCKTRSLLCPAATTPSSWAAEQICLHQVPVLQRSSLSTNNTNHSAYFWGQCSVWWGLWPLSFTLSFPVLMTLLEQLDFQSNNNQATDIQNYQEKMFHFRWLLHSG